MSPGQLNRCSFLRRCFQTAYKWKPTIFINSPVSKPASKRLRSSWNEVKLQTFKDGTGQEAGSFHETIEYHPNCVPSSLGQRCFFRPRTSQPLKVKGLRIFHINICSLKNKVSELRLFCDKHRPHVLSLNETWLDDSFLDSELYLPVYQLLRRDRDRNGGGIAVYIAEYLNPERVDISIGEIEALWFELSKPNSRKILFGATYRLPNLDPSTFTESLEEMLNRRTNESIETVLLGDFNFDYISPNVNLHEPPKFKAINQRAQPQPQEL